METLEKLLEDDTKHLAMSVANEQAVAAVLVAGPPEKAFSGTVTPQSEASIDETLWDADCDVIHYGLRRKFPTLEFEPLHVAERRFACGGGVPAQLGCRGHQVRWACRLARSLLSPRFLQRMQYDSLDTLMELEMEMDFFANAGEFECPPRLSKAFSAAWSDSSRNAAGDTPSSYSPTHRVTSMFELARYTEEAWCKLDMLEIRVACYRAYKAILQVEGPAFSACNWVLTNATPSRGEELVTCSVVVPRSSIPTLQVDFDDRINLKLFGCEILASKHDDLQRGIGGRIYVRLLDGRDPRGPATAVVQSVHVRKLHCECALRNGIKDSLQLPCPAGLIAVFNDRRVSFRDFIPPNDTSTPYYYWAPRFWVRGSHDTISVELNSFPVTLGQLKKSIRTQLGLNCLADLISVEGYTNNAAPVQPCERDKPYVFCELAVWVKRSGDPVPILALHALRPERVDREGVRPCLLCEICQRRDSQG